MYLKSLTDGEQQNKYMLIKIRTTILIFNLSFHAAKFIIL